MTTLRHVALLVDDYDAAIAWLSHCLAFETVEDVPTADKRWITMRPAGGGCSLVLAKAKDARQLAAVGQQFGGRVGFFLQTDDFGGVERRLRENGVSIIREPEDQPHGRVLVFEDAWGNRWDLIGSPPSPM